MAPRHPGAYIFAAGAQEVRTIQGACIGYQMPNSCTYHAGNVTCGPCRCLVHGNFRLLEDKAGIC